MPLREKFHRGIFKGVRNNSDTLENNGKEFLLGGAKYGISRLLSHHARLPGRQGPERGWESPGRQGPVH